MTTNDQPTPLTAEQALLNAIWHTLESVPLGAVTDALPAIVAELRDYGYQITKAQPVMVTINGAAPGMVPLRVSAVAEFISELREMADGLDAVIAAAQPTDAGEGDHHPTAAVPLPVIVGVIDLLQADRDASDRDLIAHYVTLLRGYVLEDGD